MEQVLAFYFGQNELLAALPKQHANHSEAVELLPYRSEDVLPLFFEQVGLEILPLKESEYKARKDFDSRVYGNFWQMVERENTFEMGGTIVGVEHFLSSPLEAYRQQYKLRYNLADLEQVPVVAVFEDQISDNNKQKIRRFLSNKGFHLVYVENNPTEAFLASRYSAMPTNARIMLLEATHEHIFIHTYVGSQGRRELAETINQDDLDVKLSKLVFERALASATFHISEEERQNGYKKLIPKAKEWYERTQRETQIDVWVGFDFGNQSLAILNKAEATSLLFRPDHVLNQFQINSSNYKAEIPLEKVFLLGDSLTSSALGHGLRTLHKQVEDVSSASFKRDILTGLNLQYNRKALQNYTQKIKEQAEENGLNILRNKWLALVAQAAKDGLSENGLSQILKGLNIDIIDIKDLVRKLVHNHLHNAVNKNVLTYQEVDLLTLKARNIGGNKGTLEEIFQEDGIKVVRENTPSATPEPVTNNNTTTQTTPKNPQKNTKMTDNIQKESSSKNNNFVWYAVGGILVIALLAFAVTYYINKKSTNENTLSDNTVTEQSEENNSEKANTNSETNESEANPSARVLAESDILGEYRGVLFDNELGAEFTKNVRIFDLSLSGSKGEFSYTVFPRGKGGEGYTGRIDLEQGIINFDYVENSVFKLGEYKIIANCENGMVCFEPFKDGSEKRLKRVK